LAGANSERLSAATDCWTESGTSEQLLRICWFFSWLKNLTSWLPLCSRMADRLLGFEALYFQNIALLEEKSKQKKQKMLRLCCDENDDEQMECDEKRKKGRKNEELGQWVY
jgi:hypothetical protein